MKQINITKFGHFNDGMNSDEEYILNLLSKKYKTKFTRKIDENATNIIFEGHQIINHDLLVKKLQNTNSKKILIITEDISFEKNLNFNYFTMNNEKFNFKKLIKKKSIFFELLYDHYKFKFVELFKKYIDSLKRRFPFIFNSSNTNIYELDYYWKERYLILLDLLKYINEVWYLRENNLGGYEILFKKFNIPTKVIYYRVMNLLKPVQNKKYDFIITGTLNSYRKNILNNLEKKYKIKYAKFLEINELKYMMSISKYHIILNKSEYGLFPSSSRMKIALENDCIPINDKTLFSDFLNSYSLSLNNWNDYNKIDKLIENYHQNYNFIFQKLRLEMMNKNYFSFLSEL